MAIARVHTGKALLHAKDGVEELRRRLGKMTGSGPATSEALPASADQVALVENILGAAEALVLVSDQDGLIVHFNSAATRLSGYRADDVIGKFIWDVLAPPDEAERDRANFLALVQGGSAASAESYWRISDGERRLIRWEYICLAGPDGEVAYIVATGTDVTSRKAGEASLKRELALMHTLMESLPNQIYFKDLQSRFIRVNCTQAQRFGLADPNQLLGKTDFDFFSDEHARQAFADEQRIIATGQPFSNEEKETWTDLPDAWVLTTKLPLRDPDGAIIGTFGTSVDITERKTAEEELRVRARLFAALAEFAATVNAIKEPGLLAESLVEAMGKIVPSNLVVVTLRNYDDSRYYIRSVRGLPASVVGSTIEVGDGTAGQTIASKSMIVTEPNSPSQIASALQGHMPPGSFRTVGVPLLHESLVLGVISVIRSDNEPAFSAPEREVLALLGAHTALALANAHLAEEVSVLAIRDGLTGLYNRRHFDAALELAVARSTRRVPGKTLSAVMFDLDHFGLFNEKYGHLGGDALLRHFAALLGARLRAADIVARYGGEEFVAILEDCALLDAVRLAEEVRRDLSGSFVMSAKGRKMRATVSAGCAALDPANSSAEALIGAADAALYAAKRAGRNRVMVAGSY
jgi:diguanylate cyclase (GGDEF)-like protein/PAS domain S-box-containing protein